MSIFSFLFKKHELVDGVSIKLGNKTYIIAPLNFATLKQVTPLLDSFTTLGKSPSEKDYDNMVRVIWLALRRNYPRIKFKEVETNLDISNIISISNKTMSAGGATPTGEAKAANP